MTFWGSHALEELTARAVKAEDMYTVIEELKAEEERIKDNYIELVLSLCRTQALRELAEEKLRSFQEEMGKLRRATND